MTKPPQSLLESTTSAQPLVSSHSSGGGRRTLVNAGNEAKVSRATLECFPQVGVLVLVGIDDAAVGEDDLKVGNVVASEAAAVGVEGILGILLVHHDVMVCCIRQTHSSAGSEAANTDDRGAATNRSHAVLVQRLVDFTPVGSGLDLGNLLLAVVGGGVHVAYELC